MSGEPADHIFDDQDGSELEPRVGRSRPPVHALQWEACTGPAGLASQVRSIFFYYNGQCECWVYFLMGSLACCWTDINFQPCRTLGEASSSGEHVLILSHIPFCPGACDPLCLLWNYDQVLESHAVLSGGRHYPYENKNATAEMNSIHRG